MQLLKLLTGYRPLFGHCNSISALGESAVPEKMLAHKTILLFRQ
jgi:hypothetical protein